MALTIPSQDGEINTYNLANSGIDSPLLYFVNGIRVSGREHAKTASLLSLLTERPIRGVYNKSAGPIRGFVFDMAQSALDYLQNAGARLTSFGLTADRNIPDSQLSAMVDKLMSRSVIWNKATAELFRSLVMNRYRTQFIIAHSQGNLITSNALFTMEKFLGSSSLRMVRVYSLASPSPGWPLGLRHTNGGGGRQENAFMNDLVALLRPHNLAAKIGIRRFQNAGDFRTHRGSGAVSLAPHDTNLNIALNFLQSIRNDLGMPGKIDANLLQRSSEIAAANFPEVR